MHRQPGTGHPVWQSLNEAEQQLWKNSIEAGNLYINRGITGAIVRRQPFGGMKRSAFGGGIKAGGPNYVASFVEFSENELKEVLQLTAPLCDLIADEKDKIRVNFGYASYQSAWDDEFSQEKDVCHIYGEENIFRYLPLKNVGFRVGNNDSPADILLVMMAADVAKTPLTVSISENNPNIELVKKAAKILSGTSIIVEEEQAFIGTIDRYERLRTCSKGLSDDLYQKAAKLGKHIADNQPLVEGRIELLHYLKEQSIATEYHRYGSIFGNN